MHGCSRLWPFENGAEQNVTWESIYNKALPDMVKSGHVIKADTIDELAKKLGLPVDQVKKTVARQNELWAKGEDVDSVKRSIVSPRSTSRRTTAARRPAVSSARWTVS